MLPKYIVLTFDYELFLGRNFATADEILVSPTVKLLETLRQASIKATFFIDLTYLLRLQELLADGRKSGSTNIVNLHSEYQNILDNIDQIVRGGHELGIHFHPQWKDGFYEDGRWGFRSFRRYALHNLTDVEREQLFADGMQLFQELHLRNRQNLPRHLCFRAGGWCIHPFQQLKRLFGIHSITIDSSVTVPFFRTPYFHNGPMLKPSRKLRKYSCWRFSEDPLEEDPNGPFLEVPIDTVFSSLLDLWRSRRAGRACNVGRMGEFVPGLTGIRKNILRLKKVLRFGEYTMLTLDVRNAEAAFTQLQRHSYTLGSKKGLVFISHPKQFGPESQKLLNMLIECKQFQFVPLVDYVRTCTNVAVSGG